MMSRLIKKINDFLRFVVCLRLYKTTLKPIKIKNKNFNAIRQFFDEKADYYASKIQPVIFDDDLFPFIDGLNINDMTKVSKIGDELGNVYIYKNNVYRLIEKQSESRFLDLYSSGILNAFSDFGFIPQFKIYKVNHERYSYVLKCKKSKLVFVENMSFEQSRDALLFVAFINLILEKKGYYFSDPHRYNYALQGDKFLYFDIGSIKKGQGSQYSMVVLGMYRLIAYFFPNSIFYDYLLGEKNLWSNNRPGDFNPNTVEMQNIKNYFMNYHKIKSSRIVFEITKRTLNNYLVRPEDLFVLFYYDSFESVDF